jgi:hypothetical protein
MKKRSDKVHQTVRGVDWDERPDDGCHAWEPPASRGYSTLGFRLVFDVGEGYEITAFGSGTWTVSASPYPPMMVKSKPEQSADRLGIRLARTEVKDGEP